MADPRHALGRAAEEAVAAWLLDLGWQVLARRARGSDGGEVDILAVDRTLTLVAVEVRARRSPRTGAAALSVDARRVARLRRALVALGAERGVRSVALRVDLVTAEPVHRGRWRLRRLPAIG